VLRRALLVICLCLVPVIALPSAALAGGNWLEFREDPQAAATPGEGGSGGGSLGTWAVVHVGQRVVAYTTIWARGERLQDRIDGAGTSAWLVRGDGYQNGTRLPAGAIELAPFTVRWVSGNVARVSASFTVPPVASGEYQVVVCDDPCTFSGFGEYVQGWIDVVQTPEERRLFELARDRQDDLRAATNRVRDLQRREEALRAELESVETSLRERTLSLREAVAALGREETTSSTLRRRLARTDDAPATSVTWYVVAIALAFGLAAGVALGRRRREPRFVVPDTIPDDIEESVLRS
jgi:hypothetical protein